MDHETLMAGEGINAPRGLERAAACPMAPLLTLLTRPWTMHILWNLSTRGPMRFGALRRRIEGVSARLLTVRLRELEAQGFVHRAALGGRVPQVTYSPTARLVEMNSVMELLSQLNERWQREGVAPEAQLNRDRLPAKSNAAAAP